MGTSLATAATAPMSFLPRGRSARLACFALALGLAAVSLATPPWFLLNFVGDDAFFYIVPANHLVHGAGSTFDGLNPTNGYHPLWLLILSGLVAVVNTVHDTQTMDPGVLLRVLMLFQSALIVTALAQCLALLERYATPPPGILVATFAIVFTWVFQNIFLMESCLTLGLYVAIMWLLDRWGSARPVALGCLFAQLVLSRLDQAIAVAVIGVTVFLTAPESRRRRLAKLLIAGGIPLAATIAYLVSNRIWFGHWSTTSSYAKAADGSLHQVWTTLTSQLTLSRPRTLMLFVLVAMGVASIPFLLRGASRGGFPMLVTAFLAQCAVLAADSIVLHSLRSWYFTLPALLAVVMVLAAGCAWATQRDPRFRTALFAGVFVLASAVVGVYLYQALIVHHEERDLWAFSRRLAVETSSDAILYCYDTSGTVSFGSQRRVINGDGLVNSFEYIDALSAGSLAPYFSRTKPTHFVETRHASKLSFAEGGLRTTLAGRHRFAFAPSDLVFQAPSRGGYVYALYRFDPARQYLGVTP